MKVDDLIKAHDEGKCVCEGFDESRDTQMCLAQKYLSGNIEMSELEDELLIYE